MSALGGGGGGAAASYPVAGGGTIDTSQAVILVVCRLVGQLLVESALFQGIRSCTTCTTGTATQLLL